jgi:sugar phosphate isomerase/epimerase
VSAYLGVQLYSVRDDIGPGALAGTLGRLRAMGFTHVEHFRILDATAEFAAALRETGLAATAAHADVTSDPSAAADALFAAAGRLGLDTLIVPWTEPGQLTSRDDVLRRAQAINGAAVRAADHGLTVGYHNHDFEFSQHVDGVPAYQILTDALDPAVVLELDTHWASVGGADVFSLLPALAGRVRYLHLTNEPPDDDDPPTLGVDLTGRMDSVLALGASIGALPVAEIVVHDADVFPVLERNAKYFLGVRS